MAKEMHIEKTVILNKPKQEVFDYIKFVQNMENYNVWHMSEAEKKVSTTGTDGNNGFIYRWESKDKKIGAGEQEIVQFVEGELIGYELRLEKPFKNIGNSKFTLNSISENETQLNWDYKGPTKFPLSLFIGFFRKKLGKDMEQSLQNLKAKIEE